MKQSATVISIIISTCTWPLRNGTSGRPSDLLPSILDSQVFIWLQRNPHYHGFDRSDQIRQMDKTTKKTQAKRRVMRSIRRQGQLNGSRIGLLVLRQSPTARSHSLSTDLLLQMAIGVLQKPASCSCNGNFKNIQRHFKRDSHQKRSRPNIGTSRSNSMSPSACGKKAKKG